MNPYTLHRSDLYHVTREGPGVRIRYRPEGALVWLQGDEADEFQELLDALDVDAPYAPDDACAEYFND